MVRNPVTRTILRESPDAVHQLMRVLYYEGVGELSWRDDPTPEIVHPTDALVRPIAVSTCDLDNVIIHSSRALPGAEQPFAMGHEGVGEIVEVGDAVTSLRPGDVVAIAYHISCGHCDRCADGLPLFCRETAADALAMFGMPVGEDYGGLFSELVRVPMADHSLVPVPPSVSAIDAVSVGDNLADGWRAVAPYLARRPGADVLILSTGSIGLYAADVAHACGARSVTYVDPDRARRDTAGTLGAEPVALADFDPDARKYPLALNASDDVSGATLRSCLLALSPGGHCVNTVFHFSDVTLPLLAMHFNCVTLQSGLSNARCYMPAVLRLLSSGRLHPQLIATDVLDFEEAVDALPRSGCKPVFLREPQLAPADRLHSTHRDRSLQ
jgi:threonine dehydrogenase-like Zn-dependent dehydrogenase